MCWREWQLCGACAVREHPERYPTQQAKRIKTFSKKGYIAHHKVCPDCNKQLNKMYTSYTNTWVGHNVYWCKHCKLIINYDSKISYRGLEVIEK